jgi:hypothetical protein
MLVAIITIPIAIVTVLFAIIAALFAGFVGFMTFMAPMIGLAAVIAVILDGFAQFMFSVRDAALAIIRFGTGGTSKENETTERGGGQRCLAKQRLPETMQLHTSSLGASLVLVGIFRVLADGTL